MKNVLIPTKLHDKLKIKAIHNSLNIQKTLEKILSDALEK